MTHWIRGAVRRVFDPQARSAPTERDGTSRKRMSGVSTVEYALILVAVVAAVAAAGALMQGSFNTLFDQLGDQISATEDTLDESTTTPAGPAAPAPATP